MTSDKTILMVSSSGGVLLDLLALRPWWSRHQSIWAVVKAADTLSVFAAAKATVNDSVAGPVIWIADVAMATVPRLVVSFYQAWKILHRYRPDLIVSAGSGPAIPFFLIARLLGIPTFWLSTLNILYTPGLSARICTLLASRVLLQQPSLLHTHPAGIVIGELY